MSFCFKGRPKNVLTLRKPLIQSQFKSTPTQPKLNFKLQHNLGVSSISSQLQSQHQPQPLPKNHPQLNMAVTYK